MNGRLGRGTSSGGRVIKSRRWLLSAVLASGLHSAAFAAAVLLPLPLPATLAPAPTASETEIEVEERALPEARPPKDVGPKEAFAAVGAKTAKTAKTARESSKGLDLPSQGTAPSTDATGPTESEPGSPAPFPAIPERGDESWMFSPIGQSPMNLDLSIAQRSLVGGGEGAREGAPNAGQVSTSGGLVEGLAQHDVDMGMGRGGPVVSAAERAAKVPDAPLEGSATFEVAVDASGHVNVHLGDVTSDHEGWARVASAMGGMVDTRRLRIPAGAHGLHVVVRVTAKVQYPNGLDPKVLGTHFEATPGKITETKTRIVIEKLPSVTIATVGKVCGVGVTLGLGGLSLGGGCNPENAGMGTMRVVSGQIVSESRL